MIKLTLVRGLPGSGKSTYAKTIPALHFEADMLFEDADGNYKYDRNLIGAGHDWCYRKVLTSLHQDFDVVVSNTFCAKWEMERYLNIPVIMPNVELEIVEMRTQYGSIHGVPDEAIAKMKKRWYNISNEYNVRVIE